MPIDLRRVKELFVTALDLPDLEARQAYLDQECAGDAELRARLAALLAAHEAPHPALEAPLASPVSTGPYEAPPETPGAIIAGKYKLLQHIGEGGMGSVWMADQTEPVKRRVALKLIRSERGSSKSILARFEAERQAIALMDHPHIAKLLDAGTTETGLPYFVMELVKGIPLTQYCDNQKLSVPERLRLFQEICAAVQHAHQKGVIHRDLKPSNILVESHDGKAVPKVIDFGLAKAISGQQLTEHTLFTALGQVAGTPLYMAPEQAAFNALDVDTRADIYALGVILYELLTGTTPIERAQFKQAAYDEMMRLIRESDPPAPSKRLSSSASTPSVAANRQMEPAKLGRFVKGELDWIVMKALAKERERRYEAASGLARDLERFLNHEPVQAGPPSAGYKLRKFVRRHRAQVMTAGAVLLALMAGMAGTIWGLIAARQQERIALAEAEQKKSAWQAEAERAEGERQAKQQALDQKLRAESGEKLAEERSHQLEVEKKRVEQEKQVAQAVRDFLLTKLLGQADTGAQANALIKRGGFAAAAEKDVTIRELLDRAAEELTPERIEVNFPKQPLLQAEILNTVGSTYRGVGEYPQAILFLQRAAALRQRESGPHHPETLTALQNLAITYLDAGKLPQAIALLEQVRDARVKLFGVDERSTLTVIGNLAAAYQHAGKLPEAIALLENVRVAMVKNFGPADPETLAMLNNLAVAYQEGGKLPQAISVFEQVRDTRLKELGLDHPDTLESLHNLAGAYIAAGKLAQAVSLSEQVRDVVVKKLGPNHPHTLSALDSLATAYFEAGKLPQAISLFEQVRIDREKKLGPDHPSTLITLNNLASAYQAAGQLPQAIQGFKQVSDAQIKKLGPDHPDTLTSLNNLAGAYQAAGKLPQAISLFEQVYDARLKKLSPDHPNVLLSRACLAQAYMVAGKLSQAIPLLEQSRKDIEQKFGLDHPRTWTALNNLATAYWNLKQLDKSIPLFEDVLKRQVAKLGREHPSTLATVTNLGVNYRDAGRLNEAIPLLEEAYRRGRTDPRLAGLGDGLLTAYVQAGRTTDATKLIQDQLATARKQLPADSPQLAGVLASLGRQLLEIKQYADAELILRESLTLREKLAKDKRAALWQVANVKSLLGGVLLGEKHFDAAEPLLQAGYDGLKQDEDAIPLSGRGNIAEALQRLIALADATGKKDEAAKRRKELEKIRAAPSVAPRK